MNSSSSSSFVEGLGSGLDLGEGLGSDLDWGEGLVSGLDCVECFKVELGDGNITGWAGFEVGDNDEFEGTVWEIWGLILFSDSGIVGKSTVKKKINEKNLKFCVEY